MATKDLTHGPTLMGHPTGLFSLFFVEMWERFSYYGMRALLIFYMIKGFLGMNDGRAYAVYGAYTALVYATPFVGGMLADRFLGPRFAVILGGILMALGHLVMTVENAAAFYVALALLICGNGFFKPNISTMVGSLYAKSSGRKDAGFTIFYMGINLGAAMSPIVCGYVGQVYGWHYGFGLATLGMMLGLAVFVAPLRLTQGLILLGAVGTAVSMLYLQDTTLQLVVRIFLGLALVAAGVSAFMALNKGGLPEGLGEHPDKDARKHKVGGVLRADLAVLLGVVLSIPLFALLVARNQLAGYILIIAGAIALGYLLLDVIKAEKVERERMSVVLILMFFSMLFWAFFEQAGSSINNFTDRNIDRVMEARKIEPSEVGKTLSMRIPLVTQDEELAKLPPITQEQLGFMNGAALFSLTHLTKLRDIERKIADTKAQLKKLGVVSDALPSSQPTTQAKVTPPKAPAPTKGAPDADSAKQIADLQAQLRKYRVALRDVKRFGIDSRQQELVLLERIASLAKKKKAGDLKKADLDALQTDLLDAAGVIALFTSLLPKKEQESFSAEKMEISAEAWAGLSQQIAKAQKEKTTFISQLKGAPMILAQNGKASDEVVYWKVEKAHIGMGIGGASIPAAEFQAANPIFILLFGLLFSALWSFLAVRGIEPSTPIKFALGILQLGLGFGVLWYAAKYADARGMVAISWLLFAYLLHTTGELCLSPVGLSMVTKLAPTRLVSTVMGAWFLATAFSNYLAGLIAALTGVGHGEGKEALIPPPSVTLPVYADVFGKIAIAAIISALICFALSPLLSKWMHSEVQDEA
jgi:POT family proton-dependent oligopeptide transporter